MIARKLTQTLLLSLSEFPVVALIGPRHAGKTTLAKQLARDWTGEALYLDLESITDLAKLADPEPFLSQQKDKLVILDEIQHLPGIFPLLRALIEGHGAQGRFLILGSASPELLRQSAETLAGSIIYHELTGVLISEVQQTRDTLMQLWLRGGYPLAFLADTDAESMRVRKSMLSSYVNRDLPAIGYPADPDVTQRFLSLLATGTGTVWHAQAIVRTMYITHPTIKRYRNFFEQTFMIRVLHPFTTNLRKRMVKWPIVYIRDSGILHALLDIQDMETLVENRIAGYSWEGFVIEQIAAVIPRDEQICFLSIHQGAEVDILVSRNGKPYMALEIKLSNTPTLPKDFVQLIEDLKTTKNYLVTPSSDRYPVHKQIEVISVGALCAEIASRS